MSLEKLKEKIDTLIKMPDLNIINGYLVEAVDEKYNITDNEYNKLLTEIDYDASGLLINSDGTPKFRAHRILQDLGYKVVKGESDSFGWLTGVIITPVGRIVYG